MKNLILVSLFLFGCATTQTPETPAQTVKPEHHWIQPHLRADCTQNGIGIALENQDTIDEIDVANLNKAISRCAELYTNLPCLRLFVAQGNHQYKAICGVADGEPVPAPEASPT